MQLNKKALQEENEELRHDIEQLRCDIEQWKQDAQKYKRDKEGALDRINSLNIVIDGIKKEQDETKKQAAGYKQELDGLTDIKSILRDIKFRLDGPAVSLNKQIEELMARLADEQDRANNLERDLCNRYEDSQRIQFLEGKVQAYEAMFRVNPVRIAWGEIEQGEMPESRFPL